MSEIEQKIRLLEMIQNIIDRMARNSFLLKAWSITLISALLTIYITTKNKDIIFISFIPLIMFCFLDAYYLYLERFFRDKYDIVSEDPVVKNKPVDFQIDTSSLKKMDYNIYVEVLKSTSIKCFYVPLISLIVLLWLVI